MKYVWLVVAAIPCHEESEDADICVFGYEPNEVEVARVFAEWCKEQELSELEAKEYEPVVCKRRYLP